MMQSEPRLMVYTICLLSRKFETKYYAALYFFPVSLPVNLRARLELAKTSSHICCCEATFESSSQVFCQEATKNCRCPF